MLLKQLKGLTAGMTGLAIALSLGLLPQPADAAMVSTLGARAPAPTSILVPAAAPPPATVVPTKRRPRARFRIVDGPRLKINVGPNLPGKKSWRVRVKRRESGNWRRVCTCRTVGRAETISLGQQTGKYRVRVLPRKGYRTIAARGTFTFARKAITPTSTPTYGSVSTPTPTWTPTPTSTPTPTYGAWPAPETTGPRYGSVASTGSLSSSSSGQVIARTTVTGRLTVAHDNVTVRDVTVNGTGNFMVQVVKKADGTCPVNVRFEYVEIDGALAAENDIPMESWCGYTFDHGYVHNVGRASKVHSNTTISNSYIFSDRTGDSGAHRGGIGNNGGTDNALINNVIKCQGVGCSAALPMYGDFRPVDGYLIQHNLLATTGSYCSYGGSLDSKPYPDGSNIRFVDNHFSTEYFSTCGRYGAVSGFEGGVRGNEFIGNVWHETGSPVSPN